MDLPYEVLVHLFKYLPKSDRKAASETCRDWYAAANASCFLDNKVVVCYRTIFSDEQDSPLPIFANSQTGYNNYFIHETEITSKAIEYWEQIGENVLSLTLRNCDICEKVFLQIIQNSPSLETLNVESCKDLFMSGRLLEGETKGLLQDSLTGLKSLSLSGNQYLTDALFNRFVRAAPALELLNLSSCSLQFHQGLVKKFYPPYIDAAANPSESVFTFYFVLQCIAAKAKFVKHLLFKNTLIDGVALKSLSEVKDLKLESLVVNQCDQLTNAGIVTLTDHQSFLKELDLGLCTRVTDQSLFHICSKLHNLEILSIQRCKSVGDMGIAELHKLKKLKVVNISECELITSVGVQMGLYSQVNNVLRELNLSSLNIDEDGLILMSSRLPNLSLLDVSCCFAAVTDAAIQGIIKNMLLLNTLKLTHCDKVSDAGITGMGEPFVASEDPAYTHHNNDRNRLRIYLGSRAEEEIIRDARRKLEVMRMCEKLSTDSYSGYSLVNLKGLRELDIKGCNRITDVGLTYAFDHKELATLNLSDCQQMTREGIEHLVKNCPSIEYFNLGACYNINDQAVTIIVKGLRRLKHLELRGCHQLSDKTLEAVRDNCTTLQLLDVQGCRRVSPQLAGSLGALPTLHTVLMSKPEPCLTDDDDSRTPSPKFLPLLKKLMTRRTTDRQSP